MDWTTSESLKAVKTNSQGQYRLTHNEEGHCGESLFFFRATSNNYNQVSYTKLSNDSIHVRCTEDLQTINFQLRRK